MIKKKLLLIVTGSIAACKIPILISELKKTNFHIKTVITESGKRFITPLTISSLTQNHVYDDLFSLKNEVEMGHIKLSRESDAILVAPASCNIISYMANGVANDLATSILIASNKPIFIAPAMNVFMWQNKALQRNIKQLREDGVSIIGPDKGDLACGEEGYGRLSDPTFIVDYIKNKI